MLSMLKRHEISTLAKAGHTRAEIAKLLGVSKRSVNRVVNEPPVTHVDDQAERKARGVGRPSKVAPFWQFARKCSEEDAQLPSGEILRRARGKGYEGGMSAMYALIKELRPPKSKHIVRFEAVPGEFSQHDFGEVRVTYLDGRTERIVFFATRMKFSRWAQVSVVPDQRAETLVRSV